MMTGCRVRQERLEFALDAEEELLGCWGGTMDKSVDGCGGRARERRHDPKHGVVSQIRSSTSDASSKRNLTAILAESGPYGVAFNRDPDPPHARHWRWKVRAQPANERRVLTELALIFGDVLTNLRATLDYLVWQLVLAARNSPSDEHAFPCVKLARDWASAKGRRLVGIDPAWVDEIEKLQPYHRTDKPERHLFAVLDHVNNVNKHRTLPAVIVTAPRFASKIESPDMPGRTLHLDNFLDRPIEDGVEFLRMLWDPPLDKLDVTPDSELPLRVAFRDGLDHSDGWSYTNGDLVEWVESAVAVFRPAFPS